MQPTPEEGREQRKQDKLLAHWYASEQQRKEQAGQPPNEQIEDTAEVPAIDPAIEPEGVG